MLLNKVLICATVVLLFEAPLVNCRHVHRHWHHKHGAAASSIPARLDQSRTGIGNPRFAKDVRRIRHGLNDILSMLESLLLDVEPPNRTASVSAPAPGTVGTTPAASAIRSSPVAYVPLTLYPLSPASTAVQTPARVESPTGALAVTVAGEITSTTTTTTTTTATVFQTGLFQSSLAGTGSNKTATSTAASTPASSFLSSSTLALLTQNTGTRSAAAAPTPQPLLFNPLSRSNIAVYYGQSPGTTAGGLLEICRNPYVSIVNLAFVPYFFGANGYPQTSFGPACGGPTALQSAQAPGLQNCTYLGRQIERCQREYGKIILVSLGGYIASSAFNSSAQAVGFASTLWNLFGGGTESTGLRPFGPSVVVDGFDIDNEDHSTLYYDDFFSALREQFATDPSGRRYYIGAAPQCPRPDASIPESVLRAADFVWVQFYNNEPCNLDSSGFLDSFNAWSEDLQGNSTNSGAGPRMFVGAGAWPGVGSGYVDGDELASVLDGVELLDVPNLGGMMLWDGTHALANRDGGQGYLRFAAKALQ